MKIGCVILNYNVSDLVISLVNKIKYFSSIDYIVVVHNCSTDNSFTEMQKLICSKVNVIKTNHNGGYGYGNNYGVNYLYKTYSIDYCLIVNPDVDFDNTCVSTLLKFIECSDSAIAGGIALNYKGIEQPSAWKIPSAQNYVFSSLAIINKFFYKFINNRYAKYKQPYQHVDCVVGCFLLVDAELFLSKFKYDESLFLYCEETVMGIMAQKNQISSIIVPECKYYHLHGISTKKSFKNLVKPKKMLLSSRLYVLKKYYGFNKAEIFLTKLVYNFAVFETRIIGLFLKG